MKEKIFISARVRNNRQIAPKVLSLVVHAPEIAQTARPGQFVMVYIERGDLLLPRPISICDTDTDAGTVALVYMVAGKGTAVMSELFPGCNVKILGPLGNGYQLRESDTASRECVAPDNTSPASAVRVAHHPALVGGGVGAPPLYFLAKTLIAEQNVTPNIFLGFRDVPILEYEFRDLVEPHGGEVFIATESGRNESHRGYVTELLAARGGNASEIFTCGPEPMLRAVAKFAREKKIPCVVSVEERMACGLGTCVGCVVQIGGNYVRVCTEGPVFRAEEIFEECEA
ncbi:MAG: dihydroorotate dehydrogenase electron transfer subunit [Defluviitaleaceae bacterium]|nr:dihydroorotate dehydrogenase electron transfer subunit [Defluviitaleaceae bacterium]